MREQAGYLDTLPAAWIITATALFFSALIIATVIMVWLRYWPAKKESDLGGKRRIAILIVGLIWSVNIPLLGLGFYFDNFGAPSAITIVIFILLGLLIGGYTVFRLYFIQLGFVTLHQASKTTQSKPGEEPTTSSRANVLGHLLRTVTDSLEQKDQTRSLNTWPIIFRFILLVLSGPIVVGTACYLFFAGIPSLPLIVVTVIIFILLVGYEIFSLYVFLEALNWLRRASKVKSDLQE